LAQRSSRKRRKQRQRAAKAPTVTAGAGADGSIGDGSADSATPRDQRMARSYARGRAKDEAARAALKPLAHGERPTAVTVGAIVAALAATANIVSLVVAYDSDEPGKSFSTVLGAGLLILVAVGMWRARYWAVLGLQALLAITMIGAALALMLASSLWAGTLAFLIIACSGTLFWFLVKAMARIQMPKRPGSDN
jgi:hypothetical protein